MLNKTYTTCDLYDSYGENLQVCLSQLHSYGRKSSVCGPVRLVSCYGDNSIVKRLLSEPGNGAVLVVNGENSLRHALMGDLIAKSAIAHGWAGVIVFGAVRDVRAMAVLDLHIKALGKVPRKSDRQGRGIEVENMFCGDMWWYSGDWVYSDVEGIVLSREQIGN